MQLKLQKLLLTVCLLLCGSATGQGHFGTIYTLSQLTANTTSACSANGTPAGCSAAFTGLSTNVGNTQAQTPLIDPPPGNVSWVDVHSLLPGMPSVRWIAPYQPWFGCGGHVDVKYNENSATTVGVQIQNMIARGVNVISIDHYGTDPSLSCLYTTSAAVMSYLNTNAPLSLDGSKFTGMFMVDKGAIKPACPSGPSTNTCLQNAINAQMDDVAKNWAFKPYYETDPANGKPLVQLFIIKSDWSGVNWATIYSAVHAHVQAGMSCGTGCTYTKSFELVDEFGAFNETGIEGQYMWPQPDIYVDSAPATEFCWDSINCGTSYSDTFWNAAIANPSQVAIGMVETRFDWSNASWNGGVQKIMAPQCANVQLLSAAKVIAHNATPKWMQIPTWNDYEEGTEIETGFKNCYAISGNVNGDSLAPVLTASDPYATPSTIDHLELYFGPDSTHLQLAGNYPTNTPSINLAGLVPAGSTMYLRAVGMPNVQNLMSASMAYSVTATAPYLTPPIGVNFGFQINNTPSNVQYVTVLNYGTAPLNISSISITGTNASYFSQTNTCVAPLQHNGICRIGVTFKPTASGVASAAVSVADDAAGSPHTVTLAGTGYTVTGTTYHIATTGNDANNCTSNSCLTPNHINALIAAGDALEFATGTYYLPTIQSGSPWNVTVSGTSTSPITFRPASGATVTITDLLQINSVATGCGGAPGCITVTWTDDSNDVLFPLCQTSQGCKTWKTSLTAASFTYFETMYYKQLAGPINRRSQPASSTKNAIPPNGDSTMNVCGAGGGNPCASTQGQANVACGCPSGGIGGVNCANKSSPAVEPTPWYCGFIKFEYTTGDLTPSEHSMNIGDVKVQNDAIWTSETMRLATVTNGTPNVATLTAPTAPSSGNSGFIPGHPLLIQNRRVDLGQGDWYLDRCPTGCGGNVPEATWTLYIAANTNLGENPNTDTLSVPQMPTGDALSGCGKTSLLTATGVSNLVFTGFRFQGGNWCPLPAGLADLQGVPSVPEAVSFTNSSNINWMAPGPAAPGNEILHTTGWAFGIHGNSKNWYIDGNVFGDTGAGIVRIGDIGQVTDVCTGGGQTVPSNITETNNAVEYGGRITPTGEGTCNYWGNIHHSVLQHNDILNCYGGQLNFGHQLNIGRTGGVTASCFDHNYDLWNRMRSEGLNGDYIGKLMDIGGNYGATGNSPNGPMPTGDPQFIPANYTNESGFDWISDIVSNYTLSTVYHGAACVYRDQGSSRNFIHHMLCARTQNDSIFLNTPSHCDIGLGGATCNPIAAFYDQYNFVTNSIFALPGSQTVVGTLLGSNNNRVVNRGGQNLNSFTFKSNIFYFNSANLAQMQSHPGHWEPYDFAQIPVTAGGSGYTDGKCAVTFSGGGFSTFPAGVATVVAGAVTTFDLTISGLGGTSSPTPSFTACGASGSGATIAPLTVSGGNLQVGSPVLVSPAKAFYFGQNDVYDIAQQPIAKQTCLTTNCQSGGMKTFYPNIWGDDQSEGNGDTTIDPGFICPLYAGCGSLAENWTPTANLNPIGFNMWPYQLAGRSNPFMSVAVVPNLYVPRQIDSTTDYTCMQYSGTTCLQQLAAHPYVTYGGNPAPVQPLGPQCGPPTYNCSRSDLIAAPIPTPPNLGNLVGANTCANDPDFLNKVCRITDSTTNAFTVTSGYGGDGDRNEFNTNSTKLFTESVNGPVYPMNFDPATMTAQRMYGSWSLNAGSPAWSHLNKDFFYAIPSGPWGSQYLKYDTTSSSIPTPTTAADFTTAGCLGGSFGTPAFVFAGGVSNDDQIFVAGFSNNGGQGGPGAIYVVAYKVGSGCRMLNTATGFVSGDWGPTGFVPGWVAMTDSDGILLHSLAMSKDGAYVNIVAHVPSCPTCGTNGNYFWQMATTNVVQPSGNLGGHITEGFTHWINGAGPGYNGGPGQFQSRLFTTPGTRTGIIQTFPPLTYPYDLHVGWNNVDAADTYPFCGTEYQPQSLTVPLVAWYKEVFCVSPVTGKVWRFAHTFDTSLSHRFSDLDAIGAISQDGRFFMWSSDWMGTLGSESGSSSCTVGVDCRGDVFVVQLQ